MRTTRSRALAVLLALTMVAAACGGDDDGAQDATTPEVPEVPEGAQCDATVPGTQVNYGVYAPTASLDPPFVSGSLVGGTEIAAIYDMLFRFDYETNEYVPKLAESIEPNDTFDEWTLRLREGITFSDGTVLDAQLVSDNLDRYFDPSARNASGGVLRTITDKQVQEELTLVMQLEHPWPDFPFIFADEPGMIVNLNAVGDDAEAFGANPPEAAGVGPYVLERNAPGEEMVLRARDDYWDGPVCVERVRFVFVPGSQGTWESFQAGDLDIGFLRDPVVMETARDADAAHFFNLMDASAMVLFNHADGRPAGDPLVREAMALAIDADTINQRAFQGALQAQKRLTVEGSRFFSDDVEELAVDTDRARAALEEAMAAGFDGNIELVCADSHPTPEISLAVQGMWEAVGFTVNVRSIPTSEQIGEVVQGNFDASCWGLGVDAGTGISTLLRNFSSDSASNRARYANPAMDDVLQRLVEAETEDERLEHVAEINRIFNEDFVSVNYGAIEEGVVWKDSIHGIVPTGATIFLLDKMYLDD